VKALGPFNVMDQLFHVLLWQINRCHVKVDQPLIFLDESLELWNIFIKRLLDVLPLGASVELDERQVEILQTSVVFECLEK
jgi:hypothetical protein